MRTAAYWDEGDGKGLSCGDLLSGDWAAWLRFCGQKAKKISRFCHVFSCKSSAINKMRVNVRGPAAQRAGR